MKLLIFILLSFTLVAQLHAECKLKPGFDKYNKQGMLKGPAAPKESPIDGVKYLDEAGLMALLNKKDVIFVDNRPVDFFDTCKVKNAVNKQYDFIGNGFLKKSDVEGWIKEGKRVVFYCNSIRCYRSLNATIQSVCNWNQPTDKIMWFGPGVAKLAKSNPTAVVGAGCDDPLKILVKGLKKMK